MIGTAQLLRPTSLQSNPNLGGVIVPGPHAPGRTPLTGMVPIPHMGSPQPTVAHYSLTPALQSTDPPPSPLGEIEVYEMIGTAALKDVTVYVPLIGNALRGSNTTGTTWNSV